MDTSSTITVECRELRLDRLRDALRGLRLGVAPLWASGRLPAILASPENREAISVFEGLLFDAVEQWNSARAEGKRTLTLRLEVPAGAAHAVLSLARQVCELMVDERIMLSVGIPPVSSDTARFTRGMLDHAELAIDAQDARNGQDS